MNASSAASDWRSSSDCAVAQFAPSSGTHEHFPAIDSSGQAARPHPRSELTRYYARSPPHAETYSIGSSHPTGVTCPYSTARSNFP